MDISFGSKGVLVLTGDWNGRKTVNMPRALRIEYGGAIYHVMSRGDHWGAILAMTRTGGGRRGGNAGASVAAGVWAPRRFGQNYWPKCGQRRPKIVWRN